MMDFRTRYLGLDLPHPFMAGASPLAEDLDTVRRLEDAGAAAITLPSLFEEQITREQVAGMLHMEAHSEGFAEAMSFFPEPEELMFGPEEYLDHLRRVKAAVKVPVIGSLNGTTLGGWLQHARLIQEAGADALELNVYTLAADPEASGGEIEDRTVGMLEAVKHEVTIPVALKLSPFYTSLSHLARRFEAAGADGLVLFNRFYQPDIDVETLDLRRTIQLSTSSELLLRLRWLGILSSQVRTSLAVTGGVHNPIDAVKALMAGAHAIQMVSVLLTQGPGYLAVIRDDTARWIEEHEYNSLNELRGSMNLASAPDPEGYERANYMRILQSWGGVH